MEEGTHSGLEFSRLPGLSAVCRIRRMGERVGILPARAELQPLLVPRQMLVTERGLTQRASLQAATNGHAIKWEINGRDWDFLQLFSFEI